MTLEILKSKMTWPKVAALIVMLIAATLTSQGVISEDQYSSFADFAREIARQEVLDYLEPRINPAIYTTARDYKLVVLDVEDYAVLFNGSTNKIISWAQNDDGLVGNWMLGNGTSGRTWVEKVAYIGNFIITEKQVPQNYTDISILGVLKAQDNLNDAIFETSAASTAIFIHEGEIDGNLAGQTTIDVCDGIEFRYVDNFQITDVWIHDTKGEAVTLRDSSNGYIEYKANDIENPFLTIQDSTQIDGEVQGSVSTDGALFYLKGASYCNLDLNGEIGVGSGLVLDSGGGSDTYNNRITAIIRDVADSGAIIASDSYDNTLALTASEMDDHGIQIAGDNNSISFPELNGTTATEDGIELTATASGNSIIGGHITGFDATGKYGIEELSGGDYNVIIGVDVRDNDGFFSVSGSNTVVHDMIGDPAGTGYDTSDNYYINGVPISTGGGGAGVAIPDMDYSVWYNSTTALWYGWSSNGTLITSSSDGQNVMQGVLDDTDDPKVIYVDQRYDDTDEDIYITYSGVSLINMGITHLAGKTHGTPSFRGIVLETNNDHIKNTWLLGINVNGITIDLNTGDGAAAYNIDHLHVQDCLIWGEDGTTNGEGVRLINDGGQETGYAYFVYFIDCKFVDSVDTTASTAKGIISIEDTSDGNGQWFFIRIDYKPDSQDTDSVFLGMSGRCIQVNIMQSSFVDIEHMDWTFIKLWDGGRLTDCKVISNMFELHNNATIVRVDTASTTDHNLLIDLSHNTFSFDATPGGYVKLFDNQEGDTLDWTGSFPGNVFYGRDNLIKVNYDMLSLGTLNLNTNLDFSVEILPSFPVFEMNTAEASNGDTITFDGTFAIAPWVVCSVTETDDSYFVQPHTITTTSFDIYLYDDAGAAENTDKTILYWASYDTDWHD